MPQLNVIMHLVWILPIGLMSIGCSLKPAAQYLSLDSYPRGALVKQHSKEKVESIGHTPLVIPLSQAKQSYFRFEYLDSTGQKKLTPPLTRQLKCGVDWSDPLFDKVPSLKPFIPDFIQNKIPSQLAALNPLNYMRGGKFECTPIVRAALALKAKTSGPAMCHRYIVIPPPHYRQSLSHKIMHQWEQSNLKKDSCHRIITGQEAKDTLAYLGLDHLNRKYGIEHLIYSRMMKLAYKFKATHVVFLPYEQAGQSNEQLQVKPEVYDLFSRLRDLPQLEKTYQVETQQKKSSRVIIGLKNAFRLIPNSFAFKFRFRQNLHLRPEENERLYSTRISHLKLIPSFRITNITPHYHNWGANFRFSPSFSFRRWKRQYVIKIFSGVMALKFFGHTPIGSFMARIGIGGASVDAHRSETEYENHEFSGLAQWGAEYYKFLTKRMYLTFGFRRNHLLSTPIRDGDFNLKGYSSVFVNLGFFTPEMKIKIRELFY